MTVTRIEELSRSRCKIYLEDSFAFVLYKGELRLYGVREQEELSEESYREIMQEVLPKRATLRCMNPVSYTHLRAHETRHDLVCRLLLEKKKTHETDSYLVCRLMLEKKKHYE